MAYNIVSSVAWWVKSKTAGKLHRVAEKNRSNERNIPDQIECSEWNGLEPFDLLRGWKGSEEQSREMS
ncbi:hypothetical protein [Phyllobacterium sp. SB3]|uniref:hypothetical protein n=1 Tax=Phyllobacterium sp. SB3 TaxID=3156073 RepID=UPI0032AFCEB7